MYAAVASANSTSSFKLSVDDTDITDEIAVPQATSGEDNYDEYNKVKANVTLEAGEHILRFTVTGDWMDIDYINFVKGKDAEDTDPVDDITVVAGLKFQNGGSLTYHVFGLNGKLMGKIDLTRMNVGDALKAAGFKQGVYMLRQEQGAQKFMVTVTK